MTTTDDQSTNGARAPSAPTIHRETQPVWVASDGTVLLRKVRLLFTIPLIGNAVTSTRLAELHAAITDALDREATL